MPFEFQLAAGERPTHMIIVVVPELLPQARGCSAHRRSSKGLQGACIRGKARPLDYRCTLQRGGVLAELESGTMCTLAAQTPNFKAWASHALNSPKSMIKN
eukprot:565298-Amphidinium_carterae.1